MAGGGLRGRAAGATNPRPGVRWGSPCGDPLCHLGVFSCPPAGWDRGWTLPGGMPGVCCLWCHRLGAPRGRGDPGTGCPMPAGVRNVGAGGAAPTVTWIRHAQEVPPGTAGCASTRGSGLWHHWGHGPKPHRGGVLGGSWRARGSPGEGGGWMAATRHGGCGEAAAGTGLTGSVPAPGVPGGSGGHAAGAARGPAQGHCPQGRPPR